MGESLIGKCYLPVDNSYSVNLTSASRYPYKSEDTSLAGNFSSEAKMCVIVSEPFICKVDSDLSGIRTYEMIMVEYDNKTYSILYYEGCVRDDKIIMDNGIPMIWEDEG
jgi:hypothetical protein